MNYHLNKMNLKINGFTRSEKIIDTEKIFPAFTLVNRKVNIF